MRVFRKPVTINRKDIQVGDIFYWEGERHKCRVKPFQAPNPVYLRVLTWRYGFRSYVSMLSHEKITVYR